jgi:sodium/bile acid cotransporter 7
VLSTLSRWLRNARIDLYIVAIVATAGLAALVPARGEGATAFGHLTTAAIALLFFLYGARLSPQAALAGARHWRLHLLVVISTFALFPLLGLATHALTPWLLSAALYPGVLYLCAVPSTVQSSIAFTSIATGNVAAAICSASLSSVLGIVLTPLLTSALISDSSAGFSLNSLGDIALQLLVPFAAGQACRPLIADWVGRHKRILSIVDRGSILLIVYTAFSEGMVAGIWHQVDGWSFAGLVMTCGLVLAVALGVTSYGGRRLGFNREDRITIVFCGSKKSLAAGLPMAAVLFNSADVGLMVLPLMIFHQIQLIVCAALARRYARTAPPDLGSDAAATPIHGFAAQRPATPAPRRR